MPKSVVLRLVTVFAAVAILAILCHAPLLTGLANAYIIDDPPAQSDAIVVLGGGLENRPFAAARLFHDGFAPKILYFDVKLSPTAELGLIQSEKELTRRVLLTNSVPESAIEAIGKGVASTYDESQAVRAWVARTRAKSIIIPTDIFHTRRVGWLFRKQLKDTGCEIHICAVKTRNYLAKDWWQHEEGLIAFQNECIKMPYYLIKY